MCIPHGNISSKSNGFKKEKKEKKHISKPNEEMMKKGDPDFIDERIEKKIEKKKNICEKIFGTKD